MMRLVNRLLGLVIGAGSAALGVLTLIEGVRTGIDGGFVWIPGDHWLATLQATSWSATSVIAVCALVAAVGLVLLAVELRGAQRRLIDHPSPGPGSWKLQRRSTEAHLQRRLAAQVATKPIKTRLRPRRRRWRLHVKAIAAASSRAAIEAAARAEPARLRAPQASKVTVKTTKAGQQA